MHACMPLTRDPLYDPMGHPQLQHAQAHSQQRRVARLSQNLHRVVPCSAQCVCHAAAAAGPGGPRSPACTHCHLTLHTHTAGNRKLPSGYGISVLRSDVTGPTQLAWPRPDVTSHRKWHVCGGMYKDCEYWDGRYVRERAHRAAGGHEWFGQYDDFAHLVRRQLRPGLRGLVLGSHHLLTPTISHHTFYGKQQLSLSLGL